MATDTVECQEISAFEIRKEIEIDAPDRNCLSGGAGRTRPRRTDAERQIALDED